MKSFTKVLRMALRYRITFVSSLFCALAVGVLWGGNITAVYPFVEVVFAGKTLQKWVDEKIHDAEQTAASQQAKIARLEKQLAQAPPEVRDRQATEIRLAQARLEAEQEAEKRYRWAKPYIDHYLPRDPFTTLVLITAVLLLGTIVKDLFLVGNNVLVARLAQLATFDLRKLFYRRTLRMDLSTFGEEGTADLMSRFTHDMENVAQGVETLLGKVVREPIKMIACLVGAAWICWRLLLLSLIVAPLAALLIRWLGKTLKRANRRAMEEMAQLYATLEETLRGIKIVKAFTNESQERRRFHNNSKQYFKKAMRIARYDSLSHPMTEVLGIVTICLALLAGAWLVLQGETHLLGVRMSPRPLTWPTLLIFYGLLAGVADPMRKLSEVFSRLQRAVAAADRIFDRLERVPQIRDPKQPVLCRRHHRDLVFDGVDFAYHPRQPVLKDIRLRIPFGEAIAIVGPNGCGKSTLMNLIPRFYDPTAGEIRLDGVRLPDLRIRDIRRQISVVTQETLLFDDSIFNNIRYGCPSATREQVIEAAKQAHAHRFIENELPDGYDTLAGSLGGRLSGGQRQRIALARAILRDPPIILLDEATSQVDIESEQAIQQVLEKFIHNRTAIFITHRMATLALADRIVVMQSGKILDSGTHRDLLARCEVYSRLYQIHFDDLRQTA